MADVIHRATFVQHYSVHTPDYPAQDWIVNPDLSAVSAVPKQYWKITGDVVSEMSQGEKDAVDAGQLDAKKTEKIAAIDERTAELIGDGFVYGSKAFSLSLPSQAKMMGTHQVKDHPALTYPIKWNSKDDLDFYELQNAADLESFYLTGLGTVRAHLDSGTALKDQVRAALTIADVAAIVDTR